MKRLFGLGVKMVAVSIMMVPSLSARAQQNTAVHDKDIVVSNFEDIGYPPLARVSRTQGVVGRVAHPFRADIITTVVAPPFALFKEPALSGAEGVGTSNACAMIFGDQQMKVFGHDNVAHDHEAVTLPRLFENRKKAVAAASGAQKS